VIMFGSLPQDVNLFCKTSDQYYTVVAFLYFNMLQVVQFLQYTIRQNKYSSQTTNVIFDGSCSRIKQNPLVLALILYRLHIIIFQKEHKFLKQ
jgi:hypothetical protein